MGKSLSFTEAVDRMKEWRARMDLPRTSANVVSSSFNFGKRQQVPPSRKLGSIKKPREQSFKLHRISDADKGGNECESNMSD
jgi:hypothetical protein